MSVISAFILPHPPIAIPEIGLGQQARIQTTIDSFRKVAKQIAEIKPDTIVLTSPHSILYSDYFHISPGKDAIGDFSQFTSDQLQINAVYDKEFVTELESHCGLLDFPAGTLGEKTAELDHGTMVPLKFINECYTDYKLVRIGLSGLPVTDHYRFGQHICSIADKLGRNVVFIASGDLSHKLSEDGPYGFTQEGVDFDSEVTTAMDQGDFLRFLTFDSEFTDKAAECGLRSFIIMAGALDRKKVNSKLLSYEGPFGVGYGIASFLPCGEDNNRNFLEVYTEMEHNRLKQIKENEDDYVRLARYSLETYVRTGKRANLPLDLPEEMLSQKAGVFVSLKKDGDLRGCIGTITPVRDNMGEEILMNAISAAVEDPRFAPVKQEEFDQIIYSVDVLSPPESISSSELLDVKRYGVIVTNGSRRGLLLPNLEGIDSTEQQIQIALKKAGIEDNEAYNLERFEVVRHK